MHTKATHNEAISCTYCHRIESIALHKKSNTNIIRKTEKEYFGTLKEHLDSPFHAIVTEGNPNMQNGNVCVGWYLVNPKALKPLKLENEKVASEFHEFKKESFVF